MSEHKKKKNPAATMMMTSLAYIVLGIVTVVFPQKVLDVLCYALGGAMTVYAAWRPPRGAWGFPAEGRRAAPAGSLLTEKAVCTLNL